MKGLGFIGALCLIYMGIKAIYNKKNIHNGVVVSPTSLWEEIKSLESNGISVQDRLKVSLIYQKTFFHLLNQKNEVLFLRFCLRKQVLFPSLLFQ